MILEYIMVVEYIEILQAFFLLTNISVSTFTMRNSYHFPNKPLTHFHLSRYYFTILSPSSPILSLLILTLYLNLWDLQLIRMA